MPILILELPTGRLAVDLPAHYLVELVLHEMSYFVLKCGFWAISVVFASRKPRVISAPEFGLDQPQNSTRILPPNTISKPIECAQNYGAGAATQGLPLPSALTVRRPLYFQRANRAISPPQQPQRHPLHSPQRIGRPTLSADPQSPNSPFVGCGFRRRLSHLYLLLIGLFRWFRCHGDVRGCCLLPYCPSCPWVTA